jgi:hypothetical protein
LFNVTSHLNFARKSSFRALSDIFLMPPNRTRVKHAG